MANRFTRDSTAEIWTLLEALSREGVRYFPTVAAREAEFTGPTFGMTCWTGTTAATLTQWVYNGAKWIRVWSAGFAPLAIAAAAASTPGFASVDTGLLLTVSNPDVDAIWEVTANLDVEVVAATAGTLVCNLVVAGGTYDEVLAVTCAANWGGVRLHVSHTWKVTGKAAGAMVAKVIANAVTSSAWRINSGHSHMTIKQTA